MAVSGAALLVGTAVTTIVLYVVVIRRLLDVRTGAVRTAAAAVLALVVIPVVTKAMNEGAGLSPILSGSPGDDPDLGLRVLFLCLSVVACTVGALTLLVVAELLVPTGSVPGPLDLARGGRARYHRMLRYLQILRIAMRHGLARFLRGQGGAVSRDPAARRDLARSLRQALQDGGVTFVKLGQVLSTRADLLPPEFVDELSLLQDRAEPMPWDRARAVLEEDLGAPPEQVFAEIDPEPLAAASVGQVHRARLATGEPLVVKVQRPDVGRAMERDLDIIARLADTLARRTRWGRSLGVPDLARGFARALRDELDFTVERDNMRAVAAGTDVAGIRVPRPHDTLCTRRVLVMERLDGVPLRSAGGVLTAMSADRRQELASRLLGVVLGHMLRTGIFHADPHPGNVLVADDGTLGLLDFGSVGRLDGSTRQALGRLLQAIDRLDSLGATDALLELVDRPEEIDERRLERALGHLLIRYGSPGARVGATAFAALFGLVTSAGLRIPAEVAAVFRAMATLEGTLAALRPGFDVVAAARRLGRDLFGAIPPADLWSAVEYEAATALPLIRRLPRRLDRIADAAEHGRLTVRVSLFADAGERRFVVGLVRQVLLATLGATSGLMAAILLHGDGGPRLTPDLGLHTVFGYCLLMVGIVLSLRVLILVFRRE